MIVSLIRSWRQVDALIKLMVACGLAIAVLSMIESRTGFNAFDQVPRVLPFLEVNYSRRCRSRRAAAARGPAEHAIALSAALAM